MKFDFSNLFKKISTWLGLVATAAASALAFYSELPALIQAYVPESVLQLLTVLAALAVPVATSYKQKSLRRY